ncbi:hypothetical protein KOI35_36960 [Actinoplanes bogorensis]|uniref:DUF1772 domain-containing protein n=1 Tax=Paractinoplanes bogorensis TaxID=1610840 RepID=A0ABS5Z0A0_9ACTN|nr:hypothetical protein [Actinoplanes bogorensis]MBU2669119.1 hypothetical protein [Actinoplanes bogorensis]
MRTPIMEFSHVYLTGLTVLTIYLAGVSAMTTAVSYPLYTAVPAGSFVDYHRRYNRRIPFVIVAPAFLGFLGCAAFPLVRPGEVPAAATALIAATGLIALLATVTVAIPSHLRLQRDGFSHATYRRLRSADAVRTAACFTGAATLIWSATVI